MTLRVASNPGLGEEFLRCIPRAPGTELHRAQKTRPNCWTRNIRAIRGLAARFREMGAQSRCTSPGLIPKPGLFVTRRKLSRRRVARNLRLTENLLRHCHQWNKVTHFTERGE